MVPPERVRDPMVGRLLDGRYRVGPRIARGGMASVYEATDTRLDRTVAVKVMHAGLGDDEDFAQRFVREARAAARLNHPHVVGVYDQGDDDGTVFLVMEFVPGHTLRDVIRKEAPMPAARALALLEPVVSALAAAHRAGLIHRDVKPENVLIADEGESGGAIKVADFGLAKAVSAETQHTATSGVLIGTVSYLAPELVVDGRADSRADVYAVGVVLYELLTGTKPHEGESPIQVAYRHVHHDVPPPSALVPGLPDFVDALVARATSRDSTQRPSDAGVLLHHLHRVAQALRDGVSSDPELAADLMPRPVPLDHPEQEVGEDTIALLTQVGSAEVGLLDDGTDDRTTAIERHTVVPARRPSAPAPVAPRRAPTRPAPVATTPRRRSAKGPLVLLLALLLVAGIGVGAWWFGWARYTTTPGVLGLSEQAATARLDQAGLEAAEGEPTFSESVPKGKVLQTDPSPGDRVLDGGSVTLVLSLGPERYDVPSLRGMTEDAAQDALAETRLTFGESTERWSEKVPAGQVMKSTPAAGTTLKPGDTVDLVVSKGRKPIEVRDWTGKPFDRAQAWLEGKQLVGEVTSEEFSDTVAEGDVISQTPATGTLNKGDTVQFVVSQGPELVEVPQTKAMGVEAATDALEELGFVVRTEESGSYLGLGFVLDSDPSAGSMAPKGSTVTLFLI
ncbi:Stk1 family PASTA domain-containing Ser/Thr kinase [Nocardioides seonyuensis]|nr:Stk1 family PASTA domain-containing Ser/Thr kinase [Nocardioides seonyuensis]